MNSILNKENIENAHKLAKNGAYQFNCWGATLYALNEISELCWVKVRRMADFLAHNTELYSGKLKKADILVIWNGKELLHTAIYIGGGKFWHKMGADISEFATKQGVLDNYSEGRFIEIRRMK